MSDGRYFTTTKKGEIHELKEELRSLDRPRKKEAVKKTIAAMTVGKDVSMLFPDVVNCMQTEDLELKKLVYLYLINYAKTQPDLAIMGVNTFVKDSQDPNPLIRALAVRTMGCIRVDKITEYLCDPLQRCLKDDDPYVRKTAAVCVAKLFDINPELVEDRGFIDTLREMLSDANPMVVANALAALQEIQEISGRDVLQLTSATLFKLLAALNECTEWGQVFILDSLAGYETKDPKDAEKVVERVLPRLQHVNSAVVLSSVKVILKMMDVCSNEDLIAAWSKKMAPPLVTLLSAEPEVQYVALRNINLVVQKRPSILANEVKVFFCKYNDPIYVKMEKLEIMIKLASDKNIDQVLLEFKEYAQEVDVDFVRKAVRAIGRCAVTLDRAAERCINVLLELIQTKVNYVVQEAVIVIKDIFRRYPNRYESIIATLCDNLDSLDEPEAKASMVWIIGEYAERIDNADELLETFLETFPEETSAVQLQLLSATVKLFLKKPTEVAQKMISLVLSCATNETDNPDLRDRAYIYWRLLSTDAEAAKDIVLADKPVIADDASNLDPVLLNQLLGQISTLAAVYQKPPEAFVSRQRLAVQKAEELKGHKFEEEEAAPAPDTSSAPPPSVPPPPPPPPPAVDLLDLDSEPSHPVPPAVPAAFPPAAAPGLHDVFGGLQIRPAAVAAPLGVAPAPAPTMPPQPVLAAPAVPAIMPAAVLPPSMADPFSALATSTPALQQPPLPVLLSGEAAHGLTVLGQMARQAGRMVYVLSIVNGTAGPVNGFMVQTNKSSFGLSPSNQVVDIPNIAPGASAMACVPMVVDANKLLPGPVNLTLQVALRTNQVGVLYFADQVPLAVMYEDNGAIDGQTFLASWKSLPAEAHQRLNNLVVRVEDAKARMQASNLFVLAHRQVPNSNIEALYITGRLTGLAVQVLIELRFTVGVAGLDASFKSERADLAPLVFDALTHVLG